MVGGNVELADRDNVANPAVGDDSGGAVHLRAEGEDIADSSGSALAAGLDDQHIIWSECVERALLGVVAAAVRGEEVFTVGDEPQGPGDADQAGTRLGGGDAVDADVVEAALAQLGAEGGGADGVDAGLELGGEEGCLDGLGWPRRARPAYRPPRLSTLRLVDPGLRP